LTYVPERDLLRNKRLTTIVNGRQMTQFDVCRKIKISQTAYSQIERGLFTPSEKVQKKLIKLFDLPPDYFKEQEEDEGDDE